MPRLSIPLTDEQHTAIKVKAAQAGLSQAEVARRLLFAWLADRIAMSVTGDFRYRDLSFDVDDWNVNGEKL